MSWHPISGLYREFRRRAAMTAIEDADGWTPIADGEVGATLVFRTGQSLAAEIAARRSVVALCRRNGDQPPSFVRNDVIAAFREYDVYLVRIAGSRG